MDHNEERRILAYVSAIHGFFVFPYALIALHVSDALGSSLLTYMAALTAAPIGAYLYASHRRDCQNVNIT